MDNLQSEKNVSKSQIFRAQPANIFYSKSRYYYEKNANKKQINQFKKSCTGVFSHADSEIVINMNPNTQLVQAKSEEKYPPHTRLCVFHDSIK